MDAFLDTRNIEALFAKPRRRQTEFLLEQHLLVSGSAQRQLAKGTVLCSQSVARLRALIREHEAEQQAFGTA
jgi:hypothetical protein